MQGGLRLMAEYIMWFTVLVAAYFVWAIAGFGNSPIHTGVMALVKNNADLTPVDFVLTVPANAALLIQYRRYLDKTAALSFCCWAWICWCEGPAAAPRRPNGW